MAHQIVLPDTDTAVAKRGSSALATGGAPEPTLGALFADASRDLTGLVHDELQLAKTELREEVKTGVKGGAMFGGAAVAGLFAFVMLLHAAAWGIAEFLPAWAGYLIVAVVLLAVAGVLALVGKKAVSKISAPERTLRTSKDTAAFLKNPRTHD